MYKETESRVQQDIVIWFRNNYCTKLSNPKCKIFSVPNERNDKKQQMRMLATGLESGVSDLIVLIPGRAIFVEVKTDIGKQSEKQKSFQIDVNNLGFSYHLVRSLEDFQKLIRKFEL